MLQCTVCSQWYPYVGRHREDVCPDCHERNFSGNLLESPTARHILDAYVYTPPTPRQREAMARIAETWHRQAQED